MISVDHSKNVIEAKDISFSYGGKPVLTHINLAVHQGDYLGLVGGNGAGKTTLLKIILGLVPPESGSVWLFGQDIKKFKEWERIGYVPQKATNFDTNFPATVEEVVRMGRYARRGLFNSLTHADYEKADKALEAVEMSTFKNRLVGSLSGGEQQRVFIARALAGEPEVLFLDEPTVGVEKEIRDEFYALLRKLNTDLGLTIVLVTHDMESVAHEAMHIACIDDTTFFHTSANAFFAEGDKIIHPHP